jgi:hypothetical protein
MTTRLLVNNGEGWQVAATPGAGSARGVYGPASASVKKPAGSSLRAARETGDERGFFR